MKDKDLSVAKLGRNKLTDEGLTKIIPYLSSISTLNLSKNELTEESLERLWKARKSGKLPELKSLMLGQNKIQ